MSHNKNDKFDIINFVQIFAYSQPPKQRLCLYLNDSLCLQMCVCVGILDNQYRIAT